MVKYTASCHFKNVVIEPARGEKDKLPLGGPVWPAHAKQTFIRTLRNDKVADFLAERSEAPPEVIDRPAVWCGYAVNHFGHFIAEHATRLLASRTERPDDIYVFLAPPRMTRAGMPDWFWDVLDWFGMTRAQVKVVTTKPVELRDLHVFPQAEQLGLGPTMRYIKALTKYCETRLPQRAARLGPVYVSRAGMGSGKLGGEDYLETALRAVGVTVIRPETMPLAQQLATYAAADRLIFAEGSALHGRQLLGRLEQDVHVLTRRKGWYFGRPFLTPRTRALSHIDALHGSIHFSIDPTNGQPKRWQAFAYVDGESLLSQLEGLGLPLRDVWDMQAFEQAQSADLDFWARTISKASRPEDLESRIRLLQGAFLAIGQEAQSRPLIDIARQIAAKQSVK